MRLGKIGVKLGVAAVLLWNPLVRADFIKPVEAKASSMFGGSPMNLIDGSGLSGEGSNATHSANLYATYMWHSGHNDGGLGGPTGSPPAVSNQTVIFKLNDFQPYTLTRAYIWNLNQTGNTGRGVKTMEIFCSEEENIDTAVAWTSLGIFDLTQASGEDGLAAQTLTLAATHVRLVRFVIHSHWGGDGYVGLSEVRFEGTLESPPVAFLKPIDVRTSSYYFYDMPNSGAHRMIDGSGLSENTPRGTHDNEGSAQTAWHSGNWDGGLGGPTGYPPAVSNQTVIFKLGTLQSYDLTRAYLWNMNQGPATTRSVSNLLISVSSAEDMVTATNWVDIGVFSLQKAGGSSEKAQVLALMNAENARLVRFVIHSNWGDGYVGLSEVRFAGAKGTRFEAEAEGVLPKPGITEWAKIFNQDYPVWAVFDSKAGDYSSLAQGAGSSTAETPSCTGNTADGTWINFDFGEPVTMDCVIFATRKNPSDVIGASHFIFSSDPTFDTSDTRVTLSNTGSNGHSRVHSLGTKITARYVRWEAGTCLGSQNLGAQEIRFINTPQQTVPLTSGLSIYGASASFSAAYDVSHLINGDAGGGDDYIEYASNAQGTNTYADIDLGAIVPVAGFCYFDRLNETKIASFNLILSRNTVFGDGDDIVYPYEKGLAWTRSAVFPRVYARYIRLDVTGIGGYYQTVGGSELIFFKDTRPPKGTLIRFN